MLFFDEVEVNDLDTQARRLLRIHGRLVLAHPLAAALEGLVIAEWTQQQSNLALFEQRGQMLALGLRAAF